jgi:hypothetical protein
MIAAQPLNRTTRIRTIFLERRRRYSLAEISRLAGITERKVIAGIKAGEYVASRKRGEYHFTWSELAHIAMAKWPLPVIHDALGADAALALPRLLLPQELHVRLPAYQVLMLRRLAALARVNVDSYLANYFLDLAGSEVAILNAEIPGFKAAMRFPNGDGR